MDTFRSFIVQLKRLETYKNFLIYFDELNHKWKKCIKLSCQVQKFQDTLQKASTS